MNCELKEQITSTYYKDFKVFFSKANVEGIGFGYKYINGICTCEPSIHVLVNKKVALNCLSGNGVIPKLYKGIKTDVIETGCFTSNDICNCDNDNGLTNTNGMYIERIRPIQPGYCMSTENNSPLRSPYTGTFGYIVTDNAQLSKTYCLLSVNKTFARLNTAAIGTQIIQPAYNYGGIVPQDVVAKLLRYSTIKFSNDMPNDLILYNTIDASIAAYVNVGEVQLLNPIIPEMGVPRGINSPSLSLPIQWVGCTTGKSTSTINSINVILKIKYQNFRNAWFKDIFLAKARIEFQDQGALVCDNNLKALGLLFGSSTGGNVCICNIANVIKDLNVTLLTV